MDRKESMEKHAWKRKSVAALRVLLLTMLLLSSRGTLLTVRAENEMELPAENGTEISAENETVIPAENETEIPAENETVMRAENETEMPAENAATGEASEALSVTMIGDSVMLGAAPSLLERLPGCVIDAKVSRQVIQADKVLTSLESQGAVGQTVVIALGTNGPFGTEKGQALIDRLGSGRTIYWVTVYGRELTWQEDSNAAIRALAENNENVRLIDWAQAASEHAEWICSDGIHLSVEGRAGYAGVVADELLK